MLIQQWDHLMADLAKFQRYTSLSYIWYKIWLGITDKILKIGTTQRLTCPFFGEPLYISFLQLCIFTVDKYWNPCKSELIVYFRNSLFKYFMVKHWLSVHMINSNNLGLTLTSSVQQRNCSHTNPEILTHRLLRDGYNLVNCLVS